MNNMSTFEEVQADSHVPYHPNFPPPPLYRPTSGISQQVQPNMFFQGPQPMQMFPQQGPHFYGQDGVMSEFTSPAIQYSPGYMGEHYDTNSLQEYGVQHHYSDRQNHAYQNELSFRGRRGRGQSGWRGHSHQKFTGSGHQQQFGAEAHAQYDQSYYCRSGNNSRDLMYDQNWQKNYSFYRSPPNSNNFQRNRLTSDSSKWTVKENYSNSLSKDCGSNPMDYVVNSINSNVSADSKPQNTVLLKKTIVVNSSLQKDHNSPPVRYRSSQSAKEPKSVNGNSVFTGNGAGFQKRSAFTDRRKVTVTQSSVSQKEDDGNQRGRMQEQLNKGTYECMVCCDNIRHEVAVWSCGNCFHVFHLRCIRQWARSSFDEGQDVGWRCPACQNITGHVPNQYRCFCGKVRDPQYQPGEMPHSCGEVCNKKRSGNCMHKCVILCHPGPCPPCTAVVNKTCDCGSIRKSVRCGQAISCRCEKVCEKLLNCKQHNCALVCHTGDCPPCDKKVHQECYGGHEEREVTCGSEAAFLLSFSCNKQCSKKLGCGNHLCEDLCHPGDCGTCSLMPDQITHCRCGQTPLEQLQVPSRTSCLDPVPTCEKICNKLLMCGPEENHHKCQQKCHDGACGECNGVTELTCVCGAVKKDFPCPELAKFSASAPFKCERRCNKKRMCGRHKCNETCCTRDVHICELVCGRPLNCGHHKCEELCHRGNCRPCLQASFEELPCYCGAEVIFPPVPCGTAPPTCHRLCSRQHPCEHPVRHTCHSDDACPPCTELVQKPCMGDHELRKNVACHMTDISCGRPCGKTLPCGLHKCLRPCHKGVCLTEGDLCKQPCTKRRAECGHPCGAPCHANSSKCPQVPCKTQMEIKCACGNRSAQVQCNASISMSSEIAQFQRLTVQAIVSGSPGQEMDISQLTQKKKSATRQLECDSNCALLERNRRMASALEIENPDLNAKLSGPKYSDFLKEYCRKCPDVVAKVEKAFAELVQSAKQSKQSSRSHAFPSMNREQRRLVHELAEAYGCETQSYDYEPNKNVVATASRNKCFLPSITLSASVSRKAPPPIPHHAKSAGAWSEEQTPTTLVKEKDKPDIDYFDFTPK